jgi:hypothetical protein
MLGATGIRGATPPRPARRLRFYLIAGLDPAIRSLPQQTGGTRAVVQPRHLRRASRLNCHDILFA